jgi:hypothetical protein
MGRPPIGKTAMTGAERTRRYRARFRDSKPVTKPAGPDHDALVQELAQTKAALAQAKARISDMGMEVAAQAQAFRDEVKRRAAKAKPKAEKPPLPPDEERDRKIKAQATEIRNLKARVRHMQEWTETAKGSGMSFATRGKIMKPLHPDSRKSLTEGASIPAALEAALDDAGKAFNAWADGHKPARR